MASLPYERYRDQVAAQLESLRTTLDGADLSVTVPTCPDWTLDRLVRHTGGAVRLVELHVRTRATENIPDARVPGFGGPEAGGVAALDAWLAETAEMFDATLRGAEADTPVWSWAGEATAGFWARRMTHEVAIHRADAAIAVGAPYEVAPDVAADAIDEWLDIVRFVQLAKADPRAAELVGEGRTLGLRALDAGVEWLITLGPDGVTWTRGGAGADVVLRGPLTEVLLAFYRRRGLDSGRVEVLGDRGLLEFWLAKASFG
ncbi:maleylpyruvate isomerase family mycothiol-dependent enzyme [Streptomyces sp. AN091965]|uniref:maleylpyruvate isomerase family mycothiol-dependent enzyme n=1 Tax=Streptomyces sp. AN091965 TaxID=2927803 RepID=UPI001F60337C|nr:maleylpyruvate isomerase family mycothiol-dependent enzyme [Streptomyces sp. AN091965]MCI3933373.1 maleylpyruvate isomerase family mycothiol-dependent enzyme [Streptomyces sp. AN091965]